MWQPIETAPKDGAEILLCNLYEDGDSTMVVAAWSDVMNDWRSNEPFPHEATHWMPLPEPPHQ